MTRRQAEGGETWRRLLDWDRGPKASERLAAHILRSEGYTSIDPSHPLGGPDGLKDVLCTRAGEKWVGAAYFPRGQQSFSDIRSKFESDVQGVSKNQANGIAFVTNQELRLRERERLAEDVSPVEVELFHLERIASILDCPANYGIRLEYLDIEMTKEEQVAFMATSYRVIEELQQELGRIASYISQSETLREEFEKVRAANLPKEPFYVTPAPLSPLSDPYSIAMFEETLHKCSTCGYGYLVRRQRRTHSAITTIIGQKMAITCPKCGNAEPYYGI